MAELSKPKIYRDMNAEERAAYRANQGGPASALAPVAVAPAPASAPPSDVPDIPEEERSDDDVRALTDLQKIALELGRAAGDSAEEQRSADHIWGLLNTLTKGAQQRLFANDSVRRLFNAASEKEVAGRPDDPPGTIYYRTLNGVASAWTKKPWAWRDLKDYPTVTWIPDRRRNLGWNGLMVSLIPRRNNTLPCVFHGLYEDALRQEELAEQHAKYIFNESEKPPDDPGMVTTGTSFARSTSLRGTHKGISQNVFVPGGGFAAGEPGNAQNAAQLDQ